MREVLKLIKPSEFFFDTKLGAVVDTLKDMLRIENDLDKFEKQDKTDLFCQVTSF